MSGPLLSVRNLKRHYMTTEGVLRRETGRVRAVDGVSFDVGRGEVFGLVGESGCGKSTLARTVLWLEEPTDGTVEFDGRDVATYDARERKRFRRRTGVVFQDPDASFDPRMSVGESVAEPLHVQGVHDHDRRRCIVAGLLERVGLAAEEAYRYPHEFSGGQKQRIALARALSVNPDLLVADEPVSALDVSTKAEILDLLGDLQAEFGLSILLITHDISVVERVCDRLAVMYLGRFAEVGPTERVLADPGHPYTEALLASVPTPDPTDRGIDRPLSGSVPSPADPPSGCRFHTRCPAVVQPEGYDLDQEEWRRLLSFRVRLRDGEVAPDADGDGSETGLRDRFDLPQRLSDPEAEAVLGDALDALRAGDPGRAATVLADGFTTPCERETPVWTDLDEDSEHCARCHLLDS